MGPRLSPATKHFDQHGNPTSHLAFDDFFCDSKALRRLPLRQAFDPPQDQGFAAGPRQLRQSTGNFLNLAPKSQTLLGAGLGKLNIKLLEIFTSIDRHNARTPEMIDDDAAGRLNGILAGITHTFQRRRRQNARVHLLNHVVDIERCDVETFQPVPNQGFVRQNVARQPLRSFVVTE